MQFDAHSIELVKRGELLLGHGIPLLARELAAQHLIGAIPHDADVVLALVIASNAVDAILHLALAPTPANLLDNPTPMLAADQLVNAFILRQRVDR